jgi:hypothetical protein
VAADEASCTSNQDLLGQCSPLGVSYAAMNVFRPGSRARTLGGTPRGGGAFFGVGLGLGELKKLTASREEENYVCN